MNDTPQVVTFGCRLNSYESEIIKRNVEESNVKNLVVFNTCAVTKEAEKDAKAAIRKLKKEKPDVSIIVTGCAAQNNPKMFSDMVEVDKVIGNEEKLFAKNYILGDSRVLVNDIMSVTETANHLIHSFDGRARAFIQVQNGCDHRCTFCIIPFGRGNSRSVPIGVVVNQVRLLVLEGYKEIVLTGVDVTAYGADLPGKPTFAQMIRRLLALVPELPRLRLSSIDVAEIDDDLFNLMAYETRLMPHFHISLQAGDNMILKRMKRRHNREQIVEFCHKLRDIRHDVAYGADIIAGFPTETDEMFENTNRLIEEAGIQYLHVFPYSIRESTPAARMPQVDRAKIKERSFILRESGKKQVSLFLERHHDLKARILLEKNGFGHTENFIPVKIDNISINGDVGIVDAKLSFVPGENYMMAEVENV